MDRRRFVRRVAGLGALGLSGCLARDLQPATDADATPTDPGNWPTFGADHGHTGSHPDGVGPAAGRIAWSAIDDAPTVLCSPTVVDGTVYVGSAADAIDAFDAATGDRRWRFPTVDYVETAPTVVGGRVYAADSAGVVYAISTDGEEVWRHETSRNLHSRALAVGDGRVYVGTAGTMPAVVSGGTDESKAGQVLALDADTGDERWSFAGPPDWFSGPALGDGRVYVGNHTGALVALDPATGEAVWSWRPAGEGAAHAGVLAPPTYADGTVYVGVHAAGWVVALDARTGSLEWRRDLQAENVKSSPAVTAERVYVGAHRVRAVPAVAVVERTEAATTSTPSPTPSGTPTPAPGTYGRLYALDRADGRPVWVHETDHDFRSSPAVVGDRVYVGGGDGALAVTRADGAPVWSVGFGDFVDSSPAVAGGRLYIGSADGHLHAVGDG
jgi:outer membrane protein assembly factor BamB